MSNRIPLVDLKAQYARIREDVDAAMARVVNATAFVGGEDVALFEQEFAAYCGVQHACAVANGTDALVLALRAYGVGPGDEVVTVSHTFMATVEGIQLNGATPVFVEVDPVSYTMDPALLEQAITPRTKAIVPVHIYGQPADMGPILEIGRRHGIPVMEDASQAHGASIGGRKVGSFGHSACFSLYPGKNLGAYGDAGIVVSDDADFVARVRRYANHGAGRTRYEHVAVGTNSRLDTLQAAVLRVKLRHLDGWNEERAARAAAYARELAGIPGVGLPGERPGARSVWHLYVVRVPDRAGLQAALQEQGIGSGIHYPIPCHLQEAAAPARRATDLALTEALAREVLSLPMYAELPLAEIPRIAGAVRDFQRA